EAAIERLARESRISSDAAAARLFQERFPGREVPDTPQAIRGALAESETGAAGTASALTGKRGAAVRERDKKAGTEPARLAEGERGREAGGRRTSSGARPGGDRGHSHHGETRRGIPAATDGHGAHAVIAHTLTGHDHMDALSVVRVGERAVPGALRHQRWRLIA